MQRDELEAFILIADALGSIEYIADTANADFFAPAIVDSENLLLATIC